MRQLGYDHEEIIDAAELRHLVPALSRHCVGALVARRDGAADPHRTILAFRRACKAEGVILAEGCGVEAVDRERETWLLTCAARRFQAPMVCESLRNAGRSAAASYRIRSQSAFMPSTSTLFSTSAMAGFGGLIARA